MSIRIILTPLFGEAADAGALHVGLTAAQRFQAHLWALFVRIDPFDAVPVVGEGVSPAIIEQLTEAAATEMERRRAAARDTFDAACSAAGIALADAPAGARAASAGWLEETGRRDELLPRRARASDLVVFGRSDSEATPDATAALEATLFGAGRPLLLLPPTAPATIGARVAIAWNDSPEAARAVAGALPFLDAAEAVHVLSAATRRTDPRTAEDLVGYLRWRGIAAKVEPVAAADEPVGEALLEAAAEAGADLLVMGGYGRTRLSELILGGVTRHVLNHPSLPVLMAH
jgi:nucleotide-binding universal stress UspA family protein